MTAYPDITIMARRRNARRGTRRGGMTLIELLIVVSILMIITSVSLRTMSADTKGRRQREAARAISVYLGVARSRAMELGRPCGVRFEKGLISQVETPPTLAGGSINSTCSVTTDTATGTVRATIAGAQTGDLVQLAQRWFLYNGGALIPVGTFQSPPWSNTPLPYRILRKPVKNNAPTLQLPRGTMVDLRFSGDDTYSFTVPADPTQAAATITFAPNGTIAGVWDGPATAPVAKPVTSPVYFLIAKLSDQKAPDTWKNYENYWIAIRPQTGLITVAQVAPASAADQASDRANPSTGSRKFAYEGAAKGGR